MTKSATIPHSDIGLRRDGAGDRVIAFMHGFLDDQHVWDPVIAELTASEFEIVRLDLAGFGERSETTGPFTFDRFAADLSAVVDAVDKPFVLVGHSMAAPIVELVAAGRPDRALGLLLVSPIPMAGTRLPDEAFESFRSLGELGAADYRAFRRQVSPLAPRSRTGTTCRGCREPPRRGRALPGGRVEQRLPRRRAPQQLRWPGARAPGYR
jgi:pimeloyl-ACP methyl ester carboxylesterase